MSLKLLLRIFHSWFYCYFIGGGGGGGTADTLKVSFEELFSASGIDFGLDEMKMREEEKETKKDKDEDTNVHIHVYVHAAILLCLSLSLRMFKLIHSFRIKTLSQGVLALLLLLGPFLMIRRMRYGQ